jgi:hypothetical protein
MESAWQCTEEYTLDGKRLVRRERFIGNIVVKGIVAVVLVAAAVTLILTGHALVSVPVSLAGGLFKWLGK